MTMNKPDLEETLAHYGADTTRLKPYGYTMIRCIVHDEREASMSVRLGEQKVHCFACGFHGDSVDLIQRMENFKTVGEALAYARDHFGLQSSGVRETARPERYKFRWEAEGY